MGYTSFCFLLIWSLALPLGKWRSKNTGESPKEHAPDSEVFKAWMQRRTVEPRPSQCKFSITLTAWNKKGHQGFKLACGGTPIAKLLATNVFRGFGPALARRSKQWTWPKNIKSTHFLCDHFEEIVHLFLSFVCVSPAIWSDSSLHLSMSWSSESALGRIKIHVANQKGWQTPWKEHTCPRDTDKATWLVQSTKPVAKHCFYNRHILICFGHVSGVKVQ